MKKEAPRRLFFHIREFRLLSCNLEVESQLEIGTAVKKSRKLRDQHLDDGGEVRKAFLTVDKTVEKFHDFRVGKKGGSGLSERLEKVMAKIYGHYTGLWIDAVLEYDSL